MTIKLSTCPQCGRGLSVEDLKVAHGQKGMCIYCREQLAKDVQDAKAAFYGEERGK
jgi:hypothetical protein